MDFGLSRQRANARGGGGAAGGSSSRADHHHHRHHAATDDDGAPILNIATADASFNTRGAGTPSYAAPEQMGGGVVQSACDLFPLGLIAYELFTPFGSAMERAKAFGELRAGRIPPAFVTRLPVLASLLTHLLDESPANRPTVTAVLRAIQPSPASPTASPLTSPVLRASPGVPGADAPSSIEELLGETLASLPREGSPSPPTVEEARLSPTAEQLAAASAPGPSGCGDESHKPLTVAVDCSQHEAVERPPIEAKDCAADHDWRDAELTRRLLEMQVLADELRQSEQTRGAGSQI